MKTICQKSGVPLYKSDYLLGFDLADEHPIFRAKRNLIFAPNMIHRFNFSENELEKRLIYLATLNLSYLVDWEYPATPSMKVMESTWGKLTFISQWVAFAEFHLARAISFPRYIIRKENADLHSIGSWLTAIDEIREKINKREFDRDKSAALMAREMEIKRELGEANISNRAFTPRLAKWALDLCDITIRSADYPKWMKCLCAPLNESWMLNLEDLYELQEILQNGLPNLEMNPQAISVMHQMNSLIAQQRKGFAEFNLFDEDSDFEIIGETNGIESIKVRQLPPKHMIDIPLSEPILKDYPRKIDWLLAKAKWDIAQKNKAKPPKPDDNVIGEGNV